MANSYATTSASMQMCLESFQGFMMDLDAADREGYVETAMEAITGPDSGMVLDRIYQSTMSRAGINFGKIPESLGDLTKFTRYKTIAENLLLLNKQLAEYNVPEVSLTQELHDTLIKLREDFTFGYKVDSQFLKTTYATMVYSLCEMLDLCDVIYIDMLKAGAEGKQFKSESYDNLLLVQNVKKFIAMTKNGEWAQMMLSIRKDVKNLFGDLYGDTGMITSAVKGIFGTGATLGGGKLVLNGLREDATIHAKNRVYAREYINSFHVKQPKPNGKGWASRLEIGSRAGGTAGANAVLDTAFDKAQNAASKPVNPGLQDYFGAGVDVVRNKVWSKPLGKAAIILAAIIAALILVRQLLFLYFRSIYKLDDCISDSEKVLQAHLDRTANDPSGTSKSREKQLAMYNRLASLQNTMRTKILKSDAEGRKMLKDANKKDMAPATFETSTPAVGTDDVAIL